jgi:hypothetical protein
MLLQLLSALAYVKDMLCDYYKSYPTSRTCCSTTISVSLRQWHVVQLLSALAYAKDQKNSQISGSHIKIPGSRRVTRSDLHTEDPQKCCSVILIICLGDLTSGTCTPLPPAMLKWRQYFRLSYRWLWRLVFRNVAPCNMAVFFQVQGRRLLQSTAELRESLAAHCSSATRLHGVTFHNMVVFYVTRV